jgi:hypothetical protein
LPRCSKGTTGSALSAVIIYGANSADHIIPVTEAPDREWDETNIRPAHAWPKACPDCSVAAGRPVYCNSIKGGMSLERAQRKLREMTRLPIGLEAEHRRGPEGREL